jgi:hypothetical protein
LRKGDGSGVCSLSGASLLLHPNPHRRNNSANSKSQTREKILDFSANFLHITANKLPSHFVSHQRTMAFYALISSSEDGKTEGTESAKPSRQVTPSLTRFQFYT